MYDRLSVERASARIAHGGGAELVARCWTGRGAVARAAMLGAEGSLAEAGRCEPDSWGLLAAGDVAGALRAACARGGPLAQVLEGETLLRAGAVVAGLAVLRESHHAGVAAGTVALARHLHAFGDDDGAIVVARSAEMHVGCALVRARAALGRSRASEALRALSPFLEGHVVVPDVTAVAACAVLGASALAACGRAAVLRAFATAWLDAADLDPSMLPWAVRTGWTAGEGVRAWERAGAAPAAFAGAARAELCILAGDAVAARESLGAGANVVSLSAIGLLEGEVARDPHLVRVLTHAGARVHVWCTHDRRFEPWREAARRAPADVAFFDLAAGVLPASDDGAHAATDEGSLVAALDPVRLLPGVSTVSRRGVHVALRLCRRVALGFDWPRGEDQVLRTALASDLVPADFAAVVVAAPPRALDAHRRGARCVVLAPPGDPFWNGVLPERAFAGLRVVRSSARTAWEGGALRVLDAVEALRVAPGECSG